MSGSPISRESAAKRDYWDDSNAAGHEDAVAVTSPDTPADHQATEPDIQDVAGGMGLVFADVVLAERERELHGVPVVEHASPVRQSGQDRQQRERHRAQEIETRGGSGHWRWGRRS